MKLNQTPKPLVYLLTPLLVVGLTLGITSWSQEAQAHKGHGGSIVTFLKKNAVLKAMLPNDVKTVKRKQPLKNAAITWAQETYGVELDGGIYSYYRATDKTSKRVMGAVYIGKKTYRHGDLKFAVGIDAEKRITQAAIVGVSEKYRVDFDGNVGTGLIPDYAGLSLEELITKTDELASSDKATREFAAAVRDTAVLLAAFIHASK